MHIPGHIAIAVTQHGLPPLSKDNQLLPPLLLASLFPDVIDKTVGYIFRAMPNGRHYAHNIFSLVGLSLLVTLVWGKHVGLAWFCGYLGHLLADQRSLVPWFFPMRNYNFQKGRLSFPPAQIIRETAFLILVIIIYRLSR